MLTRSFGSPLARWIGCVAFILLVVGNWTSITSRSTRVPAAQTPAAVPPISDRMPDDELRGRLDGYLTGLAASQGFAGVVVVARDGVQLFEKGYGRARRDPDEPITTQTRFNLASIGKAFTRVGVGQLMSQGKLTLADSISKHLPDYPNPDARGATIEQLLSHRGGIVDFFGRRFDAASKDQFTSNADYFRFVAPEPLLFTPGTRNQYCNGCYIVLGEIIAAVAGMPYERYISERVFAPAGMTGAGFSSYGDPEVAAGYTMREGRLQSTTSAHGRKGSAAGGSFGRAADLLAFDNALRERRLMDARGTAWFLDDEAAESGRSPGAYGIAGGAPGANCVLEANGKWTIAVAGNLDPPNAGRVAQAISKALRGP